MFRVIKRTKRLMIIDENDNIVYVPPDFLREKKQSRKKLQELCDEFNLLTSRDLNAIIKYETENWSVSSTE